MTQATLRVRLPVMSNSDLTHIDASGNAHMVDVADREVTTRTATTVGRVLLSKEVVTLLRDGAVPKGDVLATARIAGIMATKRTPDLIPLCHPIAVHGVSVELVVVDEGVDITATVKTADRTGVEMEALTAVAVAGLTVIDMVKAIDPGATITDVKMTRFWLTIEEGVQFVLDSLQRMQGGEIFVPKIPSFKVIDVAEVVAPGTPTKIIGIRPGEKLHEVMITEDDANFTVEFDKYYAILAPFLTGSDFYLRNGKKVPFGFSFTSENNKHWHSAESFKAVLRTAGLLG